MVAGFVVKLFVDGDDTNAGLEALDGEGGVPDIDLMREFANQQAVYAKELTDQTGALETAAREG